MSACSLLLRLIVLSLVSPECLSQTDASSQSKVVIDKDGTVQVPAISVPLSIYMSKEAKQRFIEDVRHPKAISAEDSSSISRKRAWHDDSARPLIESVKSRYPTNIQEQRIGGVRTYIITPRGGVAASNRQRVLINLHGGGFTVGGGLNGYGMAESIPIAGRGGFKVISIDYRMAPEYKFPAANLDIASVYKELLKQYEPANIGIYGCSAGGTLSAMSVAWFQKEKLPTPGAIGIFSAAAFGNYSAPNGYGSWNGDSRFTAPPLRGQPPPPVSGSLPLPSDAYLSSADLTDPLVSPALSPTILAGFPPTLLVTGTRAYDMSAAVQTQRELVKAGVEADLHLWDGMGHCFFMDSDIPESREAYDVIVRFFNAHLSKG